MPQQATQKSRFEYDAATAMWLLGIMLVAAIILGFVAASYQSNPRMADQHKIDKRVTIPSPDALSPPPQTRIR